MSDTEDSGTGSLQRQTTVEPLVEKDGDSHSTLTYGLESSPPVLVTLFTAFQHILICLPGCLFTAFAVSDAACVPYSHPVRATLFCGTLFMTGFCTFMQSFVGIRLPLFQGPSATFLVPLMSLQSDPEWACAENTLQSRGNETDSSFDLNSNETAEIYRKLQKMSGALMLASLAEILMGSIGVLGLLLKFIGPITVATTISLIGVSLAKIPIMYAKPNFPLALGCMLLVVIFVLYFQNVRVPIPRCRQTFDEREKQRSFPIFQLIPILIGVAIMWLISWILTIAGVFTDDKTSIHYFARADAKLDLVSQSPWFQISYPGMFGSPKLSIPLATGFVISCISSLVESVGDYYATHKACEVAPPPNHAISRGVLVEGLGSFISGTLGVGHATTSYSGNISMLTLSKNGSRAVMYGAGIILMLMSLIGKIGAALTSIPNPLLGGVSMIVNGTLVSIGLSNLKNVDMMSTRNLLVVGMPFICGMTVPMCLEMYPDVFDTGHDQANQIIHVVIGSPMFLGGLMALILDNTVPGSYASRGIDVASQGNEFHEGDEGLHVYSWSLYPRVARMIPFVYCLPFMPKRIVVHNVHSNGEMKKNGIV